jgi:Flp pilus assembly pilin Flp
MQDKRGGNAGMPSLTLRRIAWGISTWRSKEMSRVLQLVILAKIWRDERGQDLIEYALMAGFVAVAAGAIMPNVASSISTIFSQISSVLTAASTQS